MTDWESAFKSIYLLLDKSNSHLRDAVRLIKESFMWQPITKDDYPWDNERLYFLYNDSTEVVIVGIGGVSTITDFTHYKHILDPTREQVWYNDLVKRENE